MRELKIVYLEEAIHDLEDIWLYTLKTWSQEQADRYHSLIMKEIDYLATNPESGKKIYHIREGYRTSKVKSHYIFFRFTLNELEIVRILHEKMDISNRLKN